MATIVIVLAVILSFGGIVLMLALGYQDTEQTREMQAKANQAAASQRVAASKGAAAVQQAPAAGTVPGFFAPPQVTQSPAMIAFNDALVSRLEHDLQLEQAIVAQFVHHPSLNTLYQRPSAPNYVQ